MKKNQDMKNKNGFLITCVSCIVLLLTLCYFGINTSFKGTSAASTTCGSKYEKTVGSTRYCCPNSSDTVVSAAGKVWCVKSSAYTIVAADNAQGVACTTTATDDNWSHLSSDGVCADYLGSGWANVSCSPHFTKNWTCTCSASIATCATQATEPTSVNKMCYLCSTGYTWTNTPSSSCTVASQFTTEGACKAAEQARIDAMSVCYQCSSKPGGKEYHWAPDGDDFLVNDAKCVKTSIASKTACEAKNVSTYTISYNANGGSGAPNPQVKTQNVTLTLSSTKPSKSGYTFKNWNTAKDGSGTSYAAGGAYTANAAATLYAQWVEVATSTPSTKYTITFDANGGSGAPSAQTKTPGTNLTISSKKPTRSSYTFKSWNTAKDGSGASYAPGATYSTDASVTLYAQWSYNGGSGGGGGNPDPGPSEKTFTATFNPYGGTLNGSSTKSCSTTGSSCTISSLPTATKSGHTFKGWGTSSSCTSGSTSSLTLNANKTYYACYVKQSSGTGDAGGDDDIENPKTGELAIALVWMIGLFAIGYSVWYFRKAGQN